jgi:hypothetical protein
MEICGWDERDRTWGVRSGVHGNLITLVSRRCRKAQPGRDLANTPITSAHIESLS